MTHSFNLNRRSMLALGGAALAAPLVACPALAATTLRYGHNNEVASVAGAQADWFADALSQTSGGDIEVQVFPNPARERLSVSVLLADAQPVEYAVQALDGTRVLTGTQPANAGNTIIELELPAKLGQGMYVLTIGTNGQQVARMVMLGE